MSRLPARARGEGARALALTAAASTWLAGAPPLRAETPCLVAPAADEERPPGRRPERRRAYRAFGAGVPIRATTSSGQPFHSATNVLPW